MLPALAPVFALILLPALGPVVLLPPPVQFHQRERAACQRRSAGVEEREPAVISSLFMKESRPIRMVETLQAGLKDRGWKSEMDRQRRVDGWKRPEGVCIRIEGGAKG